MMSNPEDTKKMLIQQLIDLTKEGDFRDTLDECKRDLKKAPELLRKLAKVKLDQEIQGNPPFSDKQTAWRDLWHAVLEDFGVKISAMVATGTSAVERIGNITQQLKQDVTVYYWPKGTDNKVKQEVVTHFSTDWIVTGYATEKGQVSAAESQWIIFVRKT